ncbi:uncharacterized protein LOC122533878 isoform X2 [Frieseomelitta varia]|uniref:uncharacterized protein LOC122533878 isoform X2 n=1 Tax=Frieseomelitta varia TaxID=561572 RepID=UPI001CB68225|nr:uncharacterized protein LOC122533878 isoform X2 [Frieseomelitta varia]
MINESFYKNVFLLMQIVPASYECTKYFKKGMFDKPNTAGFIHVSHYLLSVHNEKRFQKLVIWPILNKTDEKRYRAEIKEYLETLANKNSDINFPPILMSHLLQAGGKKVLILMWKISEISLRAYITRACQTKLLQFPNIGDTKNITETYLTLKNIEKNHIISIFYENTKISLKSFKEYIWYISVDLLKVQTAIFETRNNLEKLVATFPVNSLIAKRLIDTDDTEIINSWKESIEQNIKFLSQKNSKLNKLKTLSSTLHNLILVLCVNHKILDGRNLPKINSRTWSFYLTGNIQLVNDGLYMNGCLVFSILLMKFNQILKQMKYYLKIHKLPDFSNCDQKIIQYCKRIKSIKEISEELMEQISDNLNNVQCSLQKKTVDYTLDEDLLNFTGLETILNSPKLNLSATYIHEEKISEMILVFSEEGRYKHLFKRYKRNNSFRNSTRYQFNDSIEDITSSWISSQKQLIYKKCSPNKIKVSPTYSRLFSINNTKIYSPYKGNTTSSPNRRNITPKKSNIQSPDARTVNIDAAIKNIFDFFCQITYLVISFVQILVEGPTLEGCHAI